MRSTGSRRPHSGLRAAAALLATLPAAGCAAPPRAAHESNDWGSFALTVDNDSYTFDDGNYSNGVRLAWVSPPTERYPEESRLRRTADRLAALLGLDHATTHVSLSGSHLIFTPENLLVPDPPPQQRAYAGVLLLEGALLARDPRGLTTLSLRLGLVGESTLAEELQTELHEWFGADDPQGWDTQIDDEPLLDLGAARYHRWAPRELGALEVDWTANAGAALGTYFTGANAGLELRLGSRLPADIGGRSMRTGLETAPLVAPPQDARATHLSFLGVEGYGVGRFLPVDGGVFEDRDREAVREDWVGKASIGYTMAQSGLSLTFAYSLLSDTFEAQRKLGQYGTISLVWFP